MDRFEGKVSVVTGAASGIGLALAHRFADAGMKVVLSDVEAGPLDVAVAEFEDKDQPVLGVRTDVSNPSDVDHLARVALSEFGGVHVLFNNAGVGSLPGSVWTASLEAWRWVTEVNFWGVVHGIRSFVPLMIEQGEAGYIVNTASIAGLLPTGQGIYSATKHAVVALTESLHFDLADIDAPIQTSVLCPGGVRTNIFTSIRNAPSGLAVDASDIPPDGRTSRRNAIVNAVQEGASPEEIASSVIEGIEYGHFYILPDRSFNSEISKRSQRIVAGHPPVFPSALLKSTQHALAAIATELGMKPLLERVLAKLEILKA